MTVPVIGVAEGTQIFFYNILGIDATTQTVPGEIKEGWPERGLGAVGRGGVPYPEVKKRAIRNSASQDTRDGCGPVRGSGPLAGTLGPEGANILQRKADTGVKQTDISITSTKSL